MTTVYAEGSRHDHEGTDAAASGASLSDDLAHGATFDRSRGPASATVVEAGESTDVVDRLLDDSWGDLDHALTPRQKVAGATITIGFIVAAIELAVLAPSTPTRAPVAVILMIAAAFAIASRVEFPVGAGYAVPTQLFLVPLFFLAPIELVPLIVFGAHVAAAFGAAIARRARFDRIIDTGVDSWHALAPAAVFMLFPPQGTDPLGFAPWLIPVLFLSQVGAETAAVTLRHWLGEGIPPKLQLRVLLQCWGIDLLLTPLAVVLAAVAFIDHRLSWAPLVPLAVVFLLEILTRDRTQRIEQAHERLEALRSERTRLEVAIQRIGDAFASKLDLDALLNITMRAAYEALDADGARASAHPGAGRRLVRRATLHEDAELEPALVAAEQAAGVTGEVSIATVNEVVAVASPVRGGADGPMAGVITLARRTGGFPDRKQELLSYLCEQAGVAAGDIERHTTLHRQALTDELTGLANHRRLQEVVALGADAFELSGAPLSFILFDLDNFKQVNDTRGHQTGDHVLRAVSEVLRSCCRGGDEAARYGGEELAIILHATELQAALKVAERARAKIAALELVDTEGRDLRVTTSIGVSSFGPGIRDPRALIAAADTALYEAKRSGKNRVHFHGATGSC